MGQIIKEKQWHGFTNLEIDGEVNEIVSVFDTQSNFLGDVNCFPVKLEGKCAESVLQSAREVNEPVFVIRAKDAAAIRALNAYISECYGIDCDEKFLSQIEDIIDNFKAFSAENPEKMKKPD